jgi:hypothetical protein
MGRGIRFDSRAGTMSWDDHWAPDTTIQFALDSVSMDSLYELALEGRFFELERPPAQAPVVREVDDWGPGPNLIFLSTGIRDSLRLADFGPQSYSPHWPGDLDHPAAFYFSDDYKRLTSFRNTLDRMIVRQPAYRQIRLPARKGGMPW